jgi:hypothetical protein
MYDECSYAYPEDLQRDDAQNRGMNMSLLDGSSHSQQWCLEQLILCERETALKDFGLYAMLWLSE